MSKLPMTPTERLAFKKASEQQWDIDEGDGSIYRHVDGDPVPLTEMTSPEDVSRELALVWSEAWPRIVALESLIKEAIGPLELYHAYGWPDRDGVIRRLKAAIAKAEGKENDKPDAQ